MPDGNRQFFEKTEPTLLKMPKTGTYQTKKLYD